MSSGVIERAGRRCGAMAKSTGEQCGNAALRGQRVCRIHGGSTKAAKTAAARRVAEQQAVAALSKHKPAPVDNPLAAFRDLAGEVVAVKDWLRKHVERLEQIRYQGGSGEQIRGELQAYTTALDACRRVLADYGRLNVDERLAAIDARMMKTYAEHAYEGIRLVLEELLPERFRLLPTLRFQALLRKQYADARVLELRGEWLAFLADADRAVGLQVELDRVRAELDAVVAQRDDLLDALRRNRSGPVLAIEAPKPQVSVL